MKLYGMEYLRRKLAEKRKRVLLRYQYYDAKQFTKDLNISSPPELRYFMNALGWCGKAVDSLGDRLQFRGFKNDTFGINEIYDLNNPDILVDSAINGALISACDFFYISNGADGFPRMQVIDGGNATGTIDPITGLLLEGYAVLERDTHDYPTVEAYLTGKATYIYRVGEEVEVFDNPTGCPLLVPMIYRRDAVRPFGHSRISRSAMDIVNAAARTIKRSEIAAEFYSYPQKYITGLSQDAELADKWKATMSTMMTFTKDDDGDHPIVGQFNQQSMAPHVEQLKMFASLFAGEMGLTMEDMGFPMSNPSSSESIKASHETLRLTARKAQRTFGSGLLNAGYVAACLRDGQKYNRSQFYGTIPRWRPIFEPDATSMSGLGDALIKIEQARPNTITTELLEDLTGFDLT